MKTDAKVNEELMKEIYALLSNNQAAVNFAIKYRDYIHYIDDLVDGDVENNAENLLKLTTLATDLYSTEFWRAYAHNLQMVEMLINNTYADSVEWERSEVAWKHRDAMCLRHCGIDMFFAVVYICCGREALRKISSRFREQAHLMHMKAGQFT